VCTIFLFQHAWLHQFSLIPIGIVFHYFISLSWFGYPDTTVAKGSFSLLKDILMACHASK
jgi:hypothetical protein